MVGGIQKNKSYYCEFTHELILFIPTFTSSTDPEKDILINFLPFTGSKSTPGIGSGATTAKSKGETSSNAKK